MEIGMGIGNSSPQGAEVCKTDCYSPPSVTSRLKAQKQELESRLNKVNEALGLLEASPDLQKAIDAISRVNY